MAHHRRSDYNNGGMPFFRLLDRTIQDSHPVSLSQATLVDPLPSMYQCLQYYI